MRMSEQRHGMTGQETGEGRDVGTSKPSGQSKHTRAEHLPTAPYEEGLVLHLQQLFTVGVIPPLCCDWKRG